MEVQETYETPEQVLEAMRQGYARYVEGLAEARSTGVGERFSFYLQGTGNPKVNQLVDGFAQAPYGKTAPNCTVITAIDGALYKEKLAALLCRE